jgi:antitoxin component YwqK of YwqJK toxin-antitoxin module
MLHSLKKWALIYMQLILKLFITVFVLFLGCKTFAQEVIIPKAKTKAERKTERKKMTLEERIEDVLPVDVTLPSASVSLPGNEKITSVEDAKKYVQETLPGYGAKGKELKAKAKKKKKEIAEAKAKIFDGKKYEGIAVEKNIYRRGSGSRMKYIEFYTLKEFQQPSIYAKSVFWYDERTKRIVEAISRDKKTNHLMHGPYKEYYGENLIKEGYYYLGTMDARWETYDRDFILQDKVYYNKGFLKDAEISYYDEGQKKIKEVIPMLYGKQTGDYYRFHEEGTLAEEGKYDDGVKVGRWVDYYESGNRRKSETQYPKDCYDTTEPIVIREYSAEGRMTFEHDSVKRM